MSLQNPSAPPLTQEPYDATYLKTLTSIYKRCERPLTSFQLRIFKKLEKTLQKSKLQARARQGKHMYTVAIFCIDCEWKFKDKQCVQVCQYFRKLYPETSHLHTTRFIKSPWWSDNMIKYTHVYFSW